MNDADTSTLIGSPSDEVTVSFVAPEAFAVGHGTNAQECVGPVDRASVVASDEDLVVVATERHRRSHVDPHVGERFDY